jgi:hypothetical protein
MLQEQQALRWIPSIKSKKLKGQAQFSGTPTSKQNL